jgi:two-component system sensor histidine kinase AlgZ
MHPVLGDRRRLALYLLTWTVVGALLTLLLAAVAQLPWAPASLVALPLSFVYAFICLNAYYLCRALPLHTTPVPRLLASLAGAAVVSSGLWLLAGRLWIGLLVRLGLHAGSPAPGARPALLGIGILLFLLAVAFHYVLEALERSRRAERQALNLKLLSRDAELKTLRSQIQPHFLFNSLNSISALIGSDPAAARRVCVLLGELLRSSLSLGTRERILLSDELAFVEKMLALEKVRFGPRLEHSLSLSGGAEACLIPPLILQPLVENAVTHGIAGLLEGGSVRLTAHQRDGRLEIQVENPHDPDGGSRPGGGVGIDNVRRRLEALYGRRARLDVTDERGRFRVTLTLPAEPPEVPGAGAGS